jgi:TolB-like protein
MKKIIFVLIITMLLGSCTSYYVSNDYQYDEFYQRHEPYQSVDDDREAARYIARNLNRYFRHTGYARIAVLNFTDEYGDHLNRGVYFADRVEMELSRYRNMRVIDRRGLYETVYDLGFTHRGLVVNKGYQLRNIARADYVLHGRIMPGTWDDVVSVRCFEVETGRVIFASTFYVERSYDLRPPGPRPYPRQHPRPPHPGYRPGRPSKEEPDEDDGQSTIKKPGEKRDPIESVGKKDLNDTKKSDSGQTQYKKKPAEETEEDDSATSGEKNKESTVSKKTLNINKKSTDQKIELKQPEVETKVKTPSRPSESNNESTVIKKTLNVNKKSTKKQIEVKKAAEETEQEEDKETETNTSGKKLKQTQIKK